MRQRRFCGTCPNLLFNDKVSHCKKYNIDLQIKMSFQGGAGPTPFEECTYVDPLIESTEDFEIEVVKNIGSDSLAAFGPPGSTRKIINGDICYKNRSDAEYWFENFPKVGTTVFDRIQAYFGEDDSYKTEFKIKAEDTQ